MTTQKWEVVVIATNEVIGTYAHPVTAQTVAAAHNRNLYNQGPWCEVRPMYATA